MPRKKPVPLLDHGVTLSGGVRRLTLEEVAALDPAKIGAAQERLRAKRDAGEHLRAESRWDNIREGYAKGRRTAARYACSLYRVLATQAAEDGDQHLSLSLAAAATRCDRIARGQAAFSEEETPRTVATRGAFEDWLVDMSRDEGEMARLFSELVDRVEVRCRRLGVEYATRPEHERAALSLASNDSRLRHAGNGLYALVRQ